MLSIRFDSPWGPMQLGNFSSTSTAHSTNLAPTSTPVLHSVDPRHKLSDVKRVQVVNVGGSWPRRLCLPVSRPLSSRGVSSSSATHTSQQCRGFARLEDELDHDMVHVEYELALQQLVSRLGLERVPPPYGTRTDQRVRTFPASWHSVVA